jgi:hypothetical protein
VGLTFIQSSVVDKGVGREHLRLERFDVWAGALLTGIIGAFVVIACAATLHAGGQSIDDAGDAAKALEPLAGSSASVLFQAGVLAQGCWRPRSCRCPGLLRQRGGRRRGPAGRRLAHRAGLPQGVRRDDRAGARRRSCWSASASRRCS